MAKRKSSAQIRAGKRLGRASRACKGKKGRAFHACRRRWLKKH